MSDPIIAIIRETPGLSALIAKRLRITAKAVRLWRQVPPKRARTVAKLLKMHPHVVRPDIYPPPRRPRQNVKEEV